MIGRAAREICGELLEKERREGVEEGRREGVEAGRQEGESSLIERMLTLKFGNLPDWVKQQIELADSDQIKVWSERILFAATLEEIFAPTSD